MIGLILSPSPRSELSLTIDEIEVQEYRKELGLSVVFNERAPRRPRGRPTSVTTEVLRDLRTAFLMGCSDNEACAYAGIHRSIYYAYKTRNPELQDFVEQWKEEPVLRARATLLRSLDNQDGALWFLERKLRGEFALRKELTGPDGGSIAMALDRLETDYGDVADKARDALGSAVEGQVVENDPPLQSKEQEG